MGTSPAPELANDFAFWHEYGFLTHMVNEYKQYGPGRYPFELISQYAGSTFWKTTQVLGAPTSKRTRRMFWHKLTSEIYYNATQPLTLG